jgi:hypothetical protein
MSEHGAAIRLALFKFAGYASRLEGLYRALSADFATTVRVIPQRRDLIMPAGDDMSDKLDRLGGSLINAILGALILWVGQTTFRHAGVLAGVDEKLVAVKEQFDQVEKRHEGIRKWLESAVNDMKDNARTQFTLKDGDKLVTQVRQSELAAGELERRFAERLSALDLRLTALEARQSDSQVVASLHAEVVQLRHDLSHVAAYAQQAQLPYDERFARGAPVFLPPVSNRR